MAGRKDKNTVDYFPHYCISGKTLFILESKYGNLGYTIWFKTLEILGNSENHYIDLRDDADMIYLISKLKISEHEFTDIYNLLAKLNAIDFDLWQNKIIYSENFIKNIEDAYKRRNNKCMDKLQLCKHLLIKCKQKDDKCIHKSTEYSKVKESKEDIREYLDNKFSESWFKWITYKKDRKEKYKSRISEKAAYDKLIKLSKNNNKLALAIVIQSIENNWAGLFEFKGKIETASTSTYDQSRYIIPRSDLFGYTHEQLTENIKQGKYILR